MPITGTGENPTTAAAILARLFGIGGGGSDALRLRGLQEGRKGELEDQFANDLATGDVRDAAARRARLGTVEDDLNEDPSMGIGEHQRVAGIQHALDQSALDVRPEMQDAADVRAQRNAFAKFLESAGTKRGEFSAESSPEGRGALDAASKRKIAEELAVPQFQMGGVSPQEVSYWAAQVGRDPSLMSQIAGNKPLAEQVRRSLASGGQDLEKLTANTRTMSEAANDLLPIMDRVTAQAEDLKKLGVFDLGIGTLRNLAASHGAGTLAKMLPWIGSDQADAVAGKIGQFNSEMGLLQSGIQRAHAGARGAGNESMAARFDKLLATQGDLPTFLGELQGARELLTQYAKHTNPSAGGSGAVPPGVSVRRVSP